jgi:hypothetical protein
MIIIDQSLEGKIILVGISHFDERENLIEQEQFSGVINRIDGSWIEISTDTDVKRIPADNVLLAPSGTYECTSNNQIVMNPDYISSWSVKPSDNKESALLWKPNYALLFNYSIPKEWKLTYSYNENRIRELIEKEGRNYLGKHVLVGITRYKTIEGKREFVEKKQVHGRISKISFKSIALLLRDGEEYSLPPDLTLLEPAEPGTYTLRSTGEVISNVDFITMWEIDSPHKYYA